jgi:hypothetical protein
MAQHRRLAASSVALNIEPPEPNRAALGLLAPPLVEARAGKLSFVLRPWGRAAIHSTRRAVVLGALVSATALPVPAALAKTSREIDNLITNLLDLLHPDLQKKNPIVKSKSITSAKIKGGFRTTISFKCGPAADTTPLYLLVLLAADPMAVAIAKDFEIVEAVVALETPRGKGKLLLPRKELKAIGKALLTGGDAAKPREALLLALDFTGIDRLAELSISTGDVDAALGRTFDVIYTDAKSENPILKTRSFATTKAEGGYQSIGTVECIATKDVRQLNALVLFLGEAYGAVIVHRGAPIVDVRARIKTPRGERSLVLPLKEVKAMGDELMKDRRDELQLKLRILEFTIAVDMSMLAELVDG